MKMEGKNVFIILRTAGPICRDFFSVVRNCQEKIFAKENFGKTQFL